MAQNSLERLYTAESNLEFLVKNGADGAMTPEEKAFTDTFDTYREKFDAAMDDDLNTADAISVIFELVRAINIAVEKAPPRPWPRPAWICSTSSPTCWACSTTRRRRAWTRP